MSDIIQLLPDALANKIAAGEVVQRPASVVKELLENAVDAKAKTITLVVKDAGRTLIQVTDDGCGMSETDARICFERHATSKLRTAEDLFAIATKGFRGEAMAAIAAVAQVELKTRRADDDLGTHIRIEGSKVLSQQPCQHACGTTVSVKNLFYNIPARRKFMKSEATQFRHIQDEFQRVALAHPDIYFTLHHNGSEIMHLPGGNYRQRVVGVLGAKTNKKLIPVREESNQTNLVSISGFVGKPEFARKTRGEQYLFVNHRFVRNKYLHHAIVSAYDDLIPKDAFPLYVLFIEVDPARVDINISPTKQEVKFQDDRIVYDCLRVVTRYALGKHHLTPTLDFDAEGGMSRFTASPVQVPEQETQTFKSKITPSQARTGSGKGSDAFVDFGAPATRDRNNLQQWETLMEGLGSNTDASATDDTLLSSATSSSAAPTSADSGEHLVNAAVRQPYQLHNAYIVSPIKSGFWLIDQQTAHERVLYEQYLAMLTDRQTASQRMLFPKELSFSAADAETLTQLLPSIQRLGFDVEPFGGQHSFVVHGMPADLGEQQDAQVLLERLLEQFRSDRDLKLDTHDSIAKAMAYAGAVRRGHALSVAEMQQLIDDLFACEMPFAGPRGNKTLITYELEELRRLFG